MKKIFKFIDHTLGTGCGLFAVICAAPFLIAGLILAVVVWVLGFVGLMFLRLAMVMFNG